MRDPKLLDEPPMEDRITDYDRDHFKTYLRLLDAEADGAEWEEVVEIVFGIDPQGDKDRAHRMHTAHLARARWMTDSGYDHLLKIGLH